MTWLSICIIWCICSQFIQLYKRKGLEAKGKKRKGRKSGEVTHRKKAEKYNSLWIYEKRRNFTANFSKFDWILYDEFSYVKMYELNWEYFTILNLRKCISLRYITHTHSTINSRLIASHPRFFVSFISRFPHTIFHFQFLNTE